MVLFTFQYTKELPGNIRVSIPAVYFTQNSYTVKQIKDLFPGLTYQTTYPIDLDYLNVPLNTLLYEDDRVLDLLSINSKLEEENRELRSKLEENVGVNPENPILDIGGSDSDERTLSENQNKETGKVISSNKKGVK